MFCLKKYSTFIYHKKVNFIYPNLLEDVDGFPLH